MSDENVEVVRRVFEGPFWEHILDFWEPQGDYYPVEKFPEARPCHGSEDIARFVREFEQA